MIRRAGTELFNFYVLEEGGRVTVVDAGLPGLRPQLDAALTALGRGIGDVEAVVLTHAHIDHVGFAGALQRERGLPVLAPRAEIPQATTGKAPATEGGLPRALVRHAMARRIVAGIVRAGGARYPKVDRVEPYGDGDDLDVPGRPRAVQTSGHSPGHCVLHVAQEGALFTGDALCGFQTITGELGPILPPKEFNSSTDGARASLERIERIEADTLYFGHGDPWTQGAAAAVSEARARDLAARGG